MNHQAAAVQAFIAGIEPDFADFDGREYIVRFQISPWNNGREHGFAISMQRDFGQRCVHFAVFEHRNTDSICVLEWETDSDYYNGVVTDEATLDRAYHGGGKHDVAATFAYGRVGEAAHWVYEHMAMFYNANNIEQAEESAVPSTYTAPDFSVKA